MKLTMAIRSPILLYTVHAQSTNIFNNKMSKSGKNIHFIGIHSFILIGLFWPKRPFVMCCALCTICHVPCSLATRTITQFTIFVGPIEISLCFYISRKQLTVNRFNVSFDPAISPTIECINLLTVSL